MVVHDFFSFDVQKALIWVATHIIQTPSLIRDLSDLIPNFEKLIV